MIVRTIIVGVIGLFLTGICQAKELSVVRFNAVPDGQLMINDEAVVWDEDKINGEPLTLNVKYLNRISYGKQSKDVMIPVVNSDDYITVLVGNVRHTIRTLPKNISGMYLDVQQPAQMDKEFYIFASLFEGSCTKRGYAVALNQNGEIIFYRGNRLGGCISDFKRTETASGEVFYSFMRQERPLNPMFFFKGHLVVLDSSFRKIDEVKPVQEGDVQDVWQENHEHIILGRGHYLTGGYSQQKVRINQSEWMSYVYGYVFQEIKDGQKIFEWKSWNYPDLFSDSIRGNNYNQSGWQDYLHANSILIDPKDNHFLLSFCSASSVIKINRETGDILWKLGGVSDEFGLTENQNFFAQHHLTWAKDGSLMLLDNHYLPMINTDKIKLTKKPSRALQFKLDERHKKLIGFKEVKTPYGIPWLGSVIELNNNHLVFGGGIRKGILGVEVDADNRPIWYLKNRTNMVTYRLMVYPKL